MAPHGVQGDHTESHAHFDEVLSSMGSLASLLENRGYVAGTGDGMLFWEYLLSRVAIDCIRATFEEWA